MCVRVMGIIKRSPRYENFISKHYLNVKNICNPANHHIKRNEAKAFDSINITCDI